jgi:hypothetical protein
MGDEPEVTPGGSRIHRHGDPRPPEPVPGGFDGAEEIEAHVERHLGPIGGVYHELASEYVHLDVLQVEAGEDRRWHTLVTSGMSSKPMEDGSRMELLIALPRDWPLDEESWREERHYWPVRLLKDLARAPHMFGFALGSGHTVPNGDPPEPYAPGTDACCALIAPPLLTPEAFDELDGPDGPIAFRAVYPLLRDEMELKLERGTDALFDAFDRAKLTELLIADRPSVVRRRKRFGLF